MLCVALPIVNLLRVLRKERLLQQQREAASTREERSVDAVGVDRIKTEEGVPEETPSRVDINPASPTGED